MTSDVNRTQLTDRLGIAPEPLCHLTPRAPWATSMTSEASSGTVPNVAPTRLAGTHSASFFAVAALPTRVRTSNSP